MLTFMYLWLPTLLSALITFVLFFMNVERANEKLLEKASLKA